MSFLTVHFFSFITEMFSSDEIAILTLRNVLSVSVGSWQDNVRLTVHGLRRKVKVVEEAEGKLNELNTDSVLILPRRA